MAQKAIKVDRNSNGRSSLVCVGVRLTMMNGYQPNNLWSVHVSMP